jgi:hypothetical protein
MNKAEFYRWLKAKVSYNLLFTGSRAFFAEVSKESDYDFVIPSEKCSEIMKEVREMGLKVQDCLKQEDICTDYGGAFPNYKIHLADGAVFNLLFPIKPGDPCPNITQIENYNCWVYATQAIQLSLALCNKLGEVELMHTLKDKKVRINLFKELIEEGPGLAYMMKEELVLTHIKGEIND